MIRGVGIDVVEVSRFEDRPEAFLAKLFTPEELEIWHKRGNVTEYLASRFAAKEAFVKALGEGFGEIGPKDVSVGDDEKGKPYIILSEKGKEMVRGSFVHLSISHERSVAVAAVVIDGEK